MKQIFYIMTLCCSSQIFAQEVVTVTSTGEEPYQNELKTTQGIRVANLQDKTNVSGYENILVTNNAGDVRKMNRDQVLQTIEDQIELANETDMRKMFYLGNVADPTKTLPIDDLVFYFSPSPLNNKFIDINMKLASAPTSNVIVHYTFFRKYNTYNNSWTTPNTYPTNVSDINQKQYQIISKTFTTSNYNQGQKINDNFDIGDVGEMYVSFPGQPHMYRIVFYARQNAATLSYNMEKNFTILVEKYTNTTDPSSYLP